MSINYCAAASLNDMTLTDHFRRIHESRGALSAALVAMSEALGCTYTPQDFGKWRRGERAVPEPVQSYMRRLVLTHLWDQHGGQRATREFLSLVLQACEPNARAREPAWTRPASFGGSVVPPLDELAS